MRLLGLEGDDSSGKDNSDPRVQQLFLKINVGDAGSVRRMVEANRHLLTAVHKGMTPLGYAGHCGRIHVMDTLLDLGADINGKDGKRRTALHRAIEGSEERAALHLIDKGADVKASSRKNQTPLHFAAIRGMTTVIARLIALGADVNATDFVGDTPIFEAINQGKDQAVQILLQEPTLNKHALNGRGFNILHQACLRGRSIAVEMILDADDHPYIDDRMNGEYTALHIAANNDHVECVGLLILLGGAIVDHGDGRRQLTPLHLACKRGQFRAAKCLIEMGANVNATDIYGSTPLHLAMGKVPEDKRVSESVDKEMTEDECIRMARLLIDSGPLWMFWTTAARLPWTTQKPQSEQLSRSTLMKWGMLFCFLVIPT
ncbi:ankyrin repeat domain-containing protein 65-like [Pomacea canaliculata]|uniref:ankyrin repeat domain-containing protein 65-like n=1 Tax=Pomacea canaliculata TaxID=400727 RepID=UPI000D72E450|nr:ankyrin repeat domain-containing protein 65-like [Pomacea canaliculata]